MAVEGGKDKRGLMMMVITVSLLTLMSAGVGFAVGLVLRNPGEVEPDKAQQSASAEAHPAEQEPTPPSAHSKAKGGDDEQPAEAAEENEEIPLEDLKTVAFPPILTTLAQPKGKWIRLEGALLAVPSSEKDHDRLAEETGEQILTYLRTLRLEDIETPSGFLGLRDDLNETVRIMSDGQVHGILIHGLVVE